MVLKICYHFIWVHRKPLRQTMRGIRERQVIKNIKVSRISKDFSVIWLLQTNLRLFIAALIMLYLTSVDLHQQDTWTFSEHQSALKLKQSWMLWIQSIQFHNFRGFNFPVPEQKRPLQKIVDSSEILHHITNWLIFGESRSQNLELEWEVSVNGVDKFLRPKSSKICQKRRSVHGS